MEKVHRQPSTGFFENISYAENYAYVNNYFKNLLSVKGIIVYQWIFVVAFNVLYKNSVV